MLSSCIPDRNHFDEYKKAKTFASIFEFAYHNRESAYLDSAIIALNDTLSRDKNFYLRVNDDSIRCIHLNDNICYELRKDNVVLYNSNRKVLFYIDSTYTLQSKIDSLISKMITKPRSGAIYLYSDTLTNKESWRDLFSMMDTILNIYNKHRAVYSLKYLKKPYDKLDKNELNDVRSKIRIYLAIYFRHPFPPLPLNTLQTEITSPDYLDTTK